MIDPTTNTIYLVSSTDEGAGTIYHRLHAIDLSTGAEKFGGPVVISGSYNGVNFNSGAQFNRPALLLQNGHVIVAFGNPCDGCSYGWIFSYSAATLAREAVFCSSKTSSGTVWMSGDGVAADSSGNLYFANGNGSYDGSENFGDSILKLGLPSGGLFPILDWFTPNIQAEENANDWDQGSGGIVVLPDIGSGAHRTCWYRRGKRGQFIWLIGRIWATGVAAGLAPTTSSKKSWVVRVG